MTVANAPRPTALDRFRREYAAIRRAEGRGADDPAHYLALPFRDTTGRFAREWRIRGRSYAAFVSRVLEPLEAAAGRPLAVLDLGAGNGWLAYRLAARGHAVAAVDLSDDARDGLGAVRVYPMEPSGRRPFAPVVASYDALPFADDAADLAVFNASLHYSTGYEATLAEALRVLRPDGRIVVLDTPVYRDPASGRRMLEERAADFRRRFGFASDALPSEGFLTYARLDELTAALSLRWRVISPRYGTRWALRGLVARLRGRREPAAFRVLVAAPRGEGVVSTHAEPRPNSPAAAGVLSLAAKAPLGRALRLPLRLIPAGTALPILATRARGRRWIAGSGPHSCWLGWNELGKRRLFQRIVAPGDVIYDVGANVGSYTILASVLAGPAGRVVAIEPVADNIAFLRRHVRLNRLENVTIVEAAAWDAAGRVGFRHGDDRLLGRVAPGAEARVPAVTLDSLVADGRAPPPDVLKIDVEGGEAAVLRGARGVLAAARPAVFLAVHGDEALEDALTLLAGTGYRARFLGRSWDELVAWHPARPRGADRTARRRADPAPEPRARPLRSAPAPRRRGARVAARRALRRAMDRAVGRRRRARPVVERVAGATVLVLPGVFNPRMFGTGEFLAASLSPRAVPPGSNVLELGTGAGAAAVVAARWADRVAAVDIDRRAVRCARINAVLNGVHDRVRVLEGDLFDPVGAERFDLVLFNPPFFRGEAAGPEDLPFRAGDIARRFAAGLAARLAPGGRALVVLSSDGDVPAFLDAFAAAGHAVTPLAERDIGTELFVLYEVRPPGPAEVAEPRGAAEPSTAAEGVEEEAANGARAGAVGAGGRAP